jgi:hypothetical protein
MDEGIAPPIAFSERTSEPGEKIIEQPVTKPAAVDRAAVTPQPPANVEAHHEKGLMAAEPPAKAAEASKAPVAIVEHQPAEAAKSEKQNLPAVDRSEPSRTPPPPKRLPATSPLFAEVGPKRSPFGKIVLIAAAVVLLIAGVAVPWGWYSRNQAAGLNSESEKEINQAVPPVASSDTAENVGPVTTSDAPVIADDTANTLNGPSPVNRENRQLEARRTESLRAKTNVAEPALTNSTAPQAADPNQRPKSQTSPSTGGKKVTVQVTYDENGRVTQASGGDATALRIARQKRFPAGKPGSATVTIPIN